MKKAIAAALLAAGMLCSSLFQVCAQETAAQETDVQDPAAQEPAAGAESASAITGDHVMVAESDTLTLWVNVMDCQIVVQEKATAREWLSFPTGLDEQEDISRTVMQNMKSQIIVSFLDTNQNVVEASSFKESVMNNTYEVMQVDNGGANHL